MSLDGRSYVFSEIAFPPFGFVLSVDGPPLSSLLYRLDHFAERKYWTREIVYLKLPVFPVFPVVSWLPGDFRTAEEINRTVAENERLGSYNLDSASLSTGLPTE